jgi:hypothetical protein
MLEGRILADPRFVLWQGLTPPVLISLEAGEPGRKSAALGRL